ncbi:MAG: hypothetical protein ACKOZU_09435, partial [Planctomycetaceae bacterium]
MSVWPAVVAAVCVAGFAARGDDATVARRLDALGANAKYVTQPGGSGPAGGITEIVVQEGSGLTPDDIAAFGDLAGLRKLQIHNCRDLDDAAVERLAGLKHLDALALTNSGVTDVAVATIVAAFPDLVDLDLSSNTNLTGTARRSI